MNRPPHRSLALLVLVFVGGTLGTAARAALTLGTTVPLDRPLRTLAVNVLGSLALGILVGWLRTRATSPGAQRMRMFLGTGVLGGFTTYSALALDTVLIAEQGHAWWAVGYGIGTVVFGAVAAFGGMWLVGRPGRSLDVQEGFAA